MRAGKRIELGYESPGKAPPAFGLASLAEERRQRKEVA